MYDAGIRNVKLIPEDTFFRVLVKYPWDGSWISCRAFFDRKLTPLLLELTELAKQREDGYGVRIVFRRAK